MLNKHIQLKFLWPPPSSHINENTGRYYTLGIASSTPIAEHRTWLSLPHPSFHDSPPMDNSFQPVADPGATTPPHSKTKLRPKGPRKFFLLEPHPSYLRVWVTVSPPYLKVWIRHWFQLPRFSFPYGPWIVHYYYYWSFILPGLNGKMPGYAPGDFVTRACKASSIFFFCPLTQVSSKQYHCLAARKRKADECKVRDKFDQGAKN